AEVTERAAVDAQQAFAEETARIGDNLRRAKEGTAAGDALAAAAGQETCASAALGGLEEALRAPAVAAMEATAHLAHLNGEHRAVALRAGLVVGEPCPVCLRPVGKLPKSSRDIEAQIKRAREAEAQALKRQREAQSRFNEATSDTKS